MSPRGRGASRLRQATDLVLAEANERSQSPAVPLNPAEVTALLVAVAALTSTMEFTPSAQRAIARDASGAVVAHHHRGRPRVDPNAQIPAAISQRVWFNVDEACQYTGLGTQAIYEALQTGELKGNQRAKNHRWRIHRDDLDVWMSGEGGQS